MNIGITNNATQQEYRVALTPSGVHALVNAGHRVFIESNAGMASGFTDVEFRDVGAVVVFSQEEAVRRGDVVLRVSPASPDICQMLNEKQVLLSFLHYGIKTEEKLRTLKNAKATAVAYELIENERGELPILIAMSEIAGRLLPQIAGHFLQNNQGGRGIALGGAPGIPSAKVVILGAGVLGTNACRAFRGIGAMVEILDTDVEHLRKIEKLFGFDVDTKMATPLTIGRAVSYADVLVGTAFNVGTDAPKLVSEQMIKSMRKGTVAIDVAIDQGGNFETSRPTSHLDPVYVMHGVTHYCVPNIPSIAARTSSFALNNTILPILMNIAQNGLDKAMETNPTIKKGLYMYKGNCTSEPLCKRFGV